MKETFEAALGMFSEFKHVVEDQVMEGEKVATRITGSGKHVGPFLGIPPTHKMVTMSGIAIHRVVGGKLVEHWGQVDGLGLLTQMGAVPAPPSPPLPAPREIKRTPGDQVLDADQMKRAVRRLFEEGMNKRNDSVIDELVDAEYVNYSFPSPPGPAGLRQDFGIFVSAFPDMRINVEDVIAEPDKAASRGHFTGTHKGTFMNVPPTGKTVAVGFIDIWVARNGRFVANWVQIDLLGALMQLGAIPAPSA
jgi:predicted ester cyclase